MYAAPSQVFRARFGYLIPKRRRLLLRRLVVVVTAVTFAILASYAVSHLHAGPDNDDDCAVCASFAGKLHDAAPPQAAAAAFVLVHRIVAAIPQPQLVRVAPALPPPNCGPPLVA
jgi:hypothetical protein